MLEIGIKGERHIHVTKEQLATCVGSGWVDVYATPMMILAMEEAAALSVEELLDEGMTTVGAAVDIRHEAATPCGMDVRVESELIEIKANGKLLVFRVEAYDEVERIGSGTHTRAIVNRAVFEQKALEKQKK